MSFCGVCRTDQCSTASTNRSKGSVFPTVTKIIAQPHKTELDPTGRHAPIEKGQHRHGREPVCPKATACARLRCCRSITCGNRTIFLAGWQDNQVRRPSR